MKKFFIGSLLIICCFGAIILLSRETENSIPHSNLADTKISLYSDKHITQNAVATNPEFKSIAFEPLVPAKHFPFSNQIASVIEAFKYFFAKYFPSPKEPVTKEYGTWIWTPIMQMTPEYVESIIAGAKADNVNAIYVSIDSYLDIFVMDKGKERDKQKEIFENKLDNFIALAESKGIAVDAEAGWRNWAEEGNEYKAFAVANFVKNFNATHEHKFRGFQYDIEPYLLESYREDSVSVLKNFAELVDKTENFLSTSTLRFSVVVPDFYDRRDTFTPKFSYNGKRDYVLTHLFDILDKRQDSSIIVMSYRNFAEGKDGSIEISKNEMRTAKRYDTRVIIAQETGDFPPPYITFHGTSKSRLWGEISKINAAFDSQPNFGGIAIHYVNSLLALE